MKLIGTKECLQELGKVDEQYLASKLLEARAGQPGHISVVLPARGSRCIGISSRKVSSPVVYVKKGARRWKQRIEQTRIRNQFFQYRQREFSSPISQAKPRLLLRQWRTLTRRIPS